MQNQPFRMLLLRFGSGPEMERSRVVYARRNGITCSCSFLSRIWPDTLIFLPLSLSYAHSLLRLRAQNKRSSVTDRTGPGLRKSTCATKRRAADAWRQGARQNPMQCKTCFWCHPHGKLSMFTQNEIEAGAVFAVLLAAARSQLGNKMTNTSCPTKHPLLSQTRDPLSRRRQEKSSQDVVNSRASIPLLWLRMLKGV